LTSKRFKLGFTRDLSRRDVLKYSVISLGVSTVAVAADVTLEQAVGKGGPGGGWPEFLIKRETDELFLKVRAVGFRARPGARRLEPLRWTSDHRLEFTLPPQHFAETTIGVSTIPDVFDDAVLRLISLSPSRESKLVFRVPARAIALRVDKLLDWSSFDLLLPDVTKAGAPYDLEIPRSPDEAVSRIEMPWGIELAPADLGAALGFTGLVQSRAQGSWTELWSTALQAKDAAARLAPLQMEVFSVRGFTRTGQTGSVEDGTLVVTYHTTPYSPDQPKSPAIETHERAELAASLSQRFLYTGRASPKRSTAQIQLVDENVPFAAAYAPGRTIAVEQFRLSGRGGTLDLLARFRPFPGSALSSWGHKATGGRDTYVQIVREGFLYPFGTRSELIFVSQRAFARDASGHFVAPLVKQAFLRIHQPNRRDFEHGETPFTSVSITTEVTPPLDLPASGNPSDYRQYDFFVPMVKGAPFAFDHLGTDWGGEQHRASMPLIFVSNKATSANGLIWEPGYSWQPDLQGPVFDPKFSIPRTGEGLRVVDRLWATLPGRFANYGGVVANLARAESTGSAAQKLDWVEWTRGNIPDLSPTEVVFPPFGARARTMRVQCQATEHLSGEKSALLATYRDLRFTAAPFLDPEPTTPAEYYFENVTAATSGPDTPYLYFLESRPLIAENAAPAERQRQQVAADIQFLYYRTSTGQLPGALFAGISNEIRFGQSQSSEGIGGLSVPDTHASIANRRYGIVGDASFNERRWPGMANARAKLQAANRLDFAAYIKASRPPFDLTPFDATRTAADRARGVSAARSLMGYAPAPAALIAAPAANGPFAPGLKLGDLFGADAEVIPGLRFADIFREIALAGAADAGPAALYDGSKRAATPLAWDVRLSGIEWLRTLQKGGETMPSLVSVLSDLVAEAKPGDTGTPLSLGLEASLNWSNDIFEPVTVGPTAFVPSPETKIEIDALARIDLGTPIIKTDPLQLAFQPGKSKIRATTAISRFAIEIFGAIRLNFESVSFTVAEDGSKDFATKLTSVELLGPLAFINQLQSMLGGLGGDNGIKLDISPERAMISQTLQFPVGGAPLFIGPAQITNLSLFWAVTIPLMGRDVLSVAFGISSREMPLTIFVPPWYGGKAYVLVEATTRGCRLVEVSMEYGALIPIEWGPARGQASLTAGIFFQLRKLDAQDSARVELTGFVKAASNLSVAGIIHFTGLIYIALSYIVENAMRIVRGTALVRVSIKIGFIRYSYSFTAEHEKRQTSDGREYNALLGVKTANVLPGSVKAGRTGTDQKNAALPYGKGFSPEARAARDRLLSGFRPEMRAA
jgi:hypothetical protein